MDHKFQDSLGNLVRSYLKSKIKRAGIQLSHKAPLDSIPRTTNKQTKTDDATYSLVCKSSDIQPGKKREGLMPGVPFRRNILKFVCKFVDEHKLLAQLQGRVGLLFCFSSPSLLTSAIKLGMVDLDNRNKPNILLYWIYKIPYFSSGSFLLSCEHVDSITECHNIDHRDYLSWKL